MIIAKIILLISSVLLIEGSEESDELLEELLENRNINKHSRPAEEENEVLNVNLVVNLRQILDVDMVHNTIHVLMWNFHQWADYKLKWESDKYGNIDTVRLPRDRVWIPDVTAFESIGDVNYDPNISKVVVLSNGDVMWVPLVSYKISCAMDVKWFPFDKHNCQMRLGSWTFDESKLNLTTIYDAVMLDNYTENSEWVLSYITGKRETIIYKYSPKEYVYIEYNIGIKRRYEFHFFVMILPILVISFIFLMVHMIPSKPICRLKSVSFVLMLLIAITVFVISKAPSHNVIPVIIIYLHLLKLLSLFSLFMSAIAHHVEFMSHRMSEFSRRMVYMIKRIICVDYCKEKNDLVYEVMPGENVESYHSTQCQDEGNENNDVDNSNGKKVYYEWKIASRVVDRLNTIICIWSCVVSLTVIVNLFRYQLT